MEKVSCNVAVSLLQGQDSGRCLPEGGRSLPFAWQSAAGPGACQHKHIWVGLHKKSLRVLRAIFGLRFLIPAQWDTAPWKENTTSSEPACLSDPKK